MIFYQYCDVEFSLFPLLERRCVIKSLPGREILSLIIDVSVEE